MRIAVACDGTTVSAHFGRCERYLLAESEGEGVPGHHADGGCSPHAKRSYRLFRLVDGAAGSEKDFAGKKGLIENDDSLFAPGDCPREVHAHLTLP